jgi:hypothetical protein
MLAVCLALFISCSKNNNSEQDSFSVSSMELAPVAKSAMAPGNNDKESAYKLNAMADTSRKIIKNGDISFEARDVKSTRKAMIGATKKLNGYISKETESGYEDDRKNYTLHIKVPAENFDALLESISTTAEKIDSKNIHIQDVTAEFIDTKTRIHNKKALEKRYLELLSKASKITDMLAIEDKLGEIRAEIESTEGQFLQMQNQVAYSTMAITFYTKSIVTETGKGFGYQFLNSLAKGWDVMAASFFSILTLWPLILVTVGLYFRYWHFRKNRNKVQKITV